MEEKTFPSIYRVLNCTKCNRKMVITEAFNGVSHTVGLWVICWDCLTPEQRKEVKAKLKTLG